MKKQIIAILLLLTVGVTSTFAQTRVTEFTIFKPITSFTHSKPMTATEAFDTYKEIITECLNEANTYAKYGDVVSEEEVQITSAKNINLLNSLMNKAELYRTSAENKQLSAQELTKGISFIESGLYTVKTNNIYCAAWIVLDDSYNYEFTEKELELLEWAREYYEPYF